MQKGAAQLLLIIVSLLVLAGGYFYFSQSKTPILNSPVISSPISSVQTYSDKEFNFEFKYSKDLTSKKDSEEEFNQRAAGSASKSVNGDFRKNFKGYVAYEPGKFLGGVVVLDKGGSYEQNPFTLWVFDNPNNLTIDAWYKNYWYYPFVWGDFTYTGKVELVPKDEATISGQMAKSGVIDYQPGKPKFVYLAKDGKMYLFRIIGESGDKILDTFKLTN